jgi:DNA transformation protein
MSLDAAIAHWMDTLAPLGRVSARKMFGGAALYADGQVFALIADDRLYFKVDGSTRPAYEAAGAGPFVYDTKDGPQTMNGYFAVPDRLLDDADELIAWAKTAVGVGRRAAQPAKGPRPGAAGAKGMRNLPKRGGK